jgi:GNAT superfamily N-acetyltransferase
MATTFTLLRPDDADRLKGLLTRWHHADGQTLDGTSAGNAIGRLVGDSRQHHTWLIESSSEVIGYLVLTFREDQAKADPRAYVSALYVAPAWRRQGFGTKASAFVRDVAHWLKVRVLAFDIAGERKHAQLLYRPSSRMLKPLPFQHEAVA